MGKPRARKLKVYQAQFGFYDTVVAAPSQAAALRAWGTHQNLFASGGAGTTIDDAAVAAALEHPETPLRRAVGSGDAFRLEPTSLPRVPDKGRQSSLAPSKPVARGTPGRPERKPADRSNLDAAEAALRKVDERRRVGEAELQRERKELDAKRSAAHDAHVEARKKATAAVAAARAAYRKAGGTN